MHGYAVAQRLAKSTAAPKRGLRKRVCLPAEAPPGGLAQELQTRAGSGKDRTLAALDRARTSFERFIEKARGKGEYDGAVAKAKERLQDIDVSRNFLLAPASPASPPLAMPPAAKP